MLRDPSAYPPGPRNYNAAIGLTWRHLAAYWWNPLSFFERMGRYGDLTYFRLFGYRAYLVNRPDLICDVLIDRREDFVKWQRQLKPLIRTMGNSLLTDEGPRWAAQRQLMQRAFTEAAVTRYEAIAAEEAEKEFDRWTPSAEVDAEPRLANLLMRINLRSFFGVTDLPDTAENLELALDIRRLSDIAQAEMFEPAGLPDWLPLPHKRLKRQIAPRVREQFSKLLDAADSPGDVHVGSVLQGAMQAANTRFTRDELRSQGLTIMMAGHHTMAEMLFWSTRVLAANPAVQTRVAQEIGVDAAANGQHTSEYLDRVLKECLRLYPAAWSLFTRQADNDTTLDGYRIRRGSIIFMAPWVTHRDPRFFPDPLRFDPDRFLPEQERRRPKGSYFPFGLGPHVCIGAATATKQVKAILVALLRRFQLEGASANSSHELTANLALRCAGGLTLSLALRHHTVRRTVAPQSSASSAVSSSLQRSEPMI